MTPLKVYKVKKCEKYLKQKVWKKEIRDEIDRMYIFTFENDAKEEIEFAFDLDDTEIFFLTNSNLKEIN